jgi:hypothetical protein
MAEESDVFVKRNDEEVFTADFFYLILILR